MEIFERIRKQRGPLGQYAHLGEGYYMFPELHGEVGSRMTFNGKEVVTIRTSARRMPRLRPSGASPTRWVRAS